MARDPATVLGAEVARAVGIVLGEPEDAPAELCRVAGRGLLAALDEAGYEVRPKTDADVLVLHGKRWRHATLGEALGRDDAIASPLVPASDGDDTHTDHRGEPQGAPDP